MMLIESNCEANNWEREGFVDVICSWPLMVLMLKQRAASEIAAAKNTALGARLGQSHGGAVHEHVRVLAIARFPRVIKEMEWFANVLGGGGGGGGDAV